VTGASARGLAGQRTGEIPGSRAKAERRDESTGVSRLPGQRPFRRLPGSSIALKVAKSMVDIYKVPEKMQFQINNSI
jgi:hypothetical protein